MIALWCKKVGVVVLNLSAKPCKPPLETSAWVNATRFGLAIA